MNVKVAPSKSSAGMSGCNSVSPAVYVSVDPAVVSVSFPAALVSVSTGLSPPQDAIVDSSIAVSRSVVIVFFIVVLPFLRLPFTDCVLLYIRAAVLSMPKRKK